MGKPSKITAPRKGHCSSATSGLSPHELRLSVSANGFDDGERSALFRCRDPSVRLSSVSAAALAEASFSKDVSTESRRRALKAFGRSFGSSYRPLAATEPARILVAWRLVRKWMKCSGRHVRGWGMAECMKGDSRSSDPWRLPDPLDPNCEYPFDGYSYGGWVKAMMEADMYSDPWHPHSIDASPPTPRIVYHRGVPPLPPDVPVAAFDHEGRIVSGYSPDDPKMDPMLHLFCKAMSSLSDSMGIMEGTQDCPELGMVALPPMLDPAICRHAWPTPRQLCEFESELSRSFRSTYMDDGKAELVDRMRLQYGLSEEERIDFLRTVEKSMRDFVATDRETAKAVQVMRLEEFSKRCRDSGDLLRELGAIKETNSILGLKTFEAERDDDLDEMATRVIELQENGMLKSGYEDVDMPEPAAPEGAEND